MICNRLKDCVEDLTEGCNREKSCMEYTDIRSSVKCEERRKIYRLNNDTGMRIRKYRMDHGIVCNEPGFDACDNLLVVYEEAAPKCIFVELKGSDLKHAVEQVSQTIRTFSGDLGKTAIYARIVHTKGIPDMRSSKTVLDLKRMVRGHGGNLKFQEWKFDEDLSKLNEM